VTRFLKLSQKQKVYKNPDFDIIRNVNMNMNNNTRENKMEYLDIKEINRFAWMNDYSFDWKDYRISPKDGSYDNGYVIV